MIGRVLTRIFGTKNERELTRLTPIVEEINRIYETLSTLSDEELRSKTEQFKAYLLEREAEVAQDVTDFEEQIGHASPEEKQKLRQKLRELRNEVFEGILPEAYAVVKEACRRLIGKKWLVCGIETEWNMVPFDVQLMGAVILHQGKVAEMATGEGKTLVATMPLYLNALLGRGAHLVTVNDYLARRDREWMGPVYEFLGLSVGCIQSGMSTEERKVEYACDITYGTNNEFGFDYLRDNMVTRAEERVQRGHYYGIVDEVDSVLIDEARTPLIISGPVERSYHQFHKIKPLVERLVHNQTVLVNNLVAQGAKLLEENNEWDAGIKLLQARRGSPKNKKLLKLEKERGVKKLIEKVELEYMRDKKLHELDEELYFSIDERGNIVDLSERGRKALAPDNPHLFVLPDLAVEGEKINTDASMSTEEKVKKRAELDRTYAEKSEEIHSIRQLLKAYSLFEKDVEYVLQDGRVLIVDEFTGRLMPGRRYSDGLHQALEAKEGVTIETETQTLATITLQNYFRMYDKLAGMTGTAETEAREFWDIYKLDVVVVPTNEPVRRVDYDDVIYKTKREKYNAVIEEIERMHLANRPVLVGTVSVEVSETLSRMLKRKGIPHEVLNAKHHQREAEIVAKAGEAGKVTIATNMAGRGTDIKLGKNVVACERCCILCEDRDCANCGKAETLSQCLKDVPCGLRIVGTERHEARRIDRQLRGRSGRQGDPGSSRFYLSLEDDLMRVFGSERITGLMDRIGVGEGEAIEHSLISKAIENAQKRVEAFNFDIRKRLLEYDDVMNRQREVVYALRNEVLDKEGLRPRIQEFMEEKLDEVLDAYVNPKLPPEEWNWPGLRAELAKTFLFDLDVKETDFKNLNSEVLREKMLALVKFVYDRKEEEIEPERMRQLERLVMLRVIDQKWRDHLYALDYLREGIYLRAYGQKDPLLEYKRDSFDMFQELTSTISEDVIRYILGFRIPSAREGRQTVRAYKPSYAASQVSAGSRAEEKPAPVRTEGKIGRNDPCPCGSGKKYKKCCGRIS
ncbi:preprotein translocase subunit SecA [candidate division TA06 bacterium DG_26]|uniref:Protein translocase subunit SecA n=1 Tax=candidate division TA06 bacterium DG_26 TaxID=1703771 RepID=A0A0S7WJY8_UNCT6|nr:MAG: preprotein translocase subunit SecA [candidate division TA06 bacterium DG_26]